MADLEIEHVAFRIVLVPTDATSPRFTAQILRKDGRFFSFDDKTGVEPASHRHHLVSVMTTDVFDTADEAFDAGRNLAEACKTSE